jgi:hypothetical protein
MLKTAGDPLPQEAALRARAYPPPSFAYEDRRPRSRRPSQRVFLAGTHWPSEARYATLDLAGLQPEQQRGGLRLVAVPEHGDGDRGTVRDDGH